MYIYTAFFSSEFLFEITACAWREGQTQRQVACVRCMHVIFNYLCLWLFLIMSVLIASYCHAGGACMQHICFVMTNFGGFLRGGSFSNIPLFLLLVIYNFYYLCSEISDVCSFEFEWI
jgi:hypothetical protein